MSRRSRGLHTVPWDEDEEEEEEEAEREEESVCACVRRVGGGGEGKDDRLAHKSERGGGVRGWEGAGGPYVRPFQFAYPLCNL